MFKMTYETIVSLLISHFQYFNYCLLKKLQQKIISLKNKLFTRPELLEKNK